MNRVQDAVDCARHRLAVAIGEKRRDTPLVHPRDRVDMHTGLSFAAVAVVPRSLLQPPAVMTGPKDEDVALAQADALRLLGGLELGPSHRLAGFQVRNATQARDVEQDTSTHDPLGIGRYGEAVPALARHIRHPPSPMPQPPTPDVLEGVAVCAA